ncbi:MAG: hypothetical protein ACLSIR_04245 [Christensenellales bacterium]
MTNKAQITADVMAACLNGICRRDGDEPPIVDVAEAAAWHVVTETPRRIPAAGRHSTFALLLEPEPRRRATAGRRGARRPARTSAFSASRWRRLPGRRSA